MNLHQTHTFVILDLSPQSYREIAAKLKAAGYDHAFMKSDGRNVIDMQGIAVAAIPTLADLPTEKVFCPKCGAEIEGLRGDNVFLTEHNCDAIKAMIAGTTSRSHK